MYVDHFEHSVNIQPLRKQVKVQLTMEASFRLFTEGINRWWPLTTHSVGEARAEACFFEGWAGGRIVEVLKDGSQAEWGRVLTWEPYQRVSFQWYPGREPDSAQIVTVTFSEIPAGTLVELVHSGWETLGEEARARRDGYDTGWDSVLAKYVLQSERKL